MKNLFYFIAGVLFITLISATTVSIMTVKPATPKSVLIKSFWSYSGIQEDVEKFIKNSVKQGYIVKTVSVSSDTNYQRAVVVMEKY
jgi:hypothetical protein